MPQDLLQKYGAPKTDLLKKYGAPERGLLDKYGAPPAQESPWYKNLGHTAIEGFSGLLKLADKLGEGLGDVGGPATSPLTGTPPDQPVDPHEMAQAAIPITPEGHNTASGVAGSAIGGLAQLPITGPFTPASFAAQSGMEGFDQAKAKGLSDKEAWTAGILHGATTLGTMKAIPMVAQRIPSISKWLPEPLQKVEEASGGLLSKVLRNATAFGSVGLMDQVLQNLIHQHTDEPQRRLWTGLEGRAATDAITGTIMSLFAPGHPMSPEVRNATQAATVPAPGPEFVQTGEKPPPDLAQDVTLGQPAKAPMSIPAEPEHPAADQIREMGAVTSRMSDLDARAKDLRQRGKTAASLPLDEERLGLLKRQQELALEIVSRTAMAGAAPAPTEAPHPIDQRLANPDMRSYLRHMAGEMGTYQEQGQAVDQETGDYHEALANKGTTNYVNYAEWWNDRPSGNTMTQEEIKSMVNKVTSDKPGQIGPRQREMLDFMLGHIEDQIPPEERWQGPLQDQIAAEHQSNGATPEEANSVAAEEVDRIKKAVAGNGGVPNIDPPPPTDTEEPPDPNGPDWRPWLQKYLSDVNEGRFSAWRLKQSRWTDLMKALKLSPAEYLAEQRKPKGQRLWEQVNNAMSFSADTLGKLDEEMGKFGDELQPQHMKLAQDAANLNPATLALRDKILDANNRWSGLLKDWRIIGNSVENYTKRIWNGLDDEAPKKGVGGGKFSTFTTGRLPRVYSSMVEGFARGNTLKVPGMIEQEFVNRTTTSEVKAANDAVEGGLKSGVLRTDPKPGYTLLDQPNFKAWDTKHPIKIKIPDTPLELKPLLEDQLQEKNIPIDEIVKVYGQARRGEDGQIWGRDMAITSDGNTITIMRKMPLYGPADLATKLKNYMQRPRIPVVDGIINAIRSSLFLVPIRHMANVSANFMLGAPGEEGSVLPSNPVSSYKQGMETIRNYQPDLKALVRNNLALVPSGEMQRVVEAEHNMVGRFVDKVPGISQAKNFIQNELNDLKRFTFERYIPARQAHIAQLEQSRLMSLGFGEEESARAGARLANNLAGVKNPDIIRNRYLSYGGSLLFTAPQYEASAWQRVADMYGSGATANAHRAMFARALYRTAGLYVAFNVANALMQDKDHPVDQFFSNMEDQYGKGWRRFFGIDMTQALQRAGRDNPTKLYMEFTGNMLEPAGELLIGSGAAANYEGKRGPAAAGADYFDAKESWMMRFISSLHSGTNWRGDPYTSFGEMQGTDEKGNYKGTKYGHYYPGMPKGGQLEGQITSKRSSEKEGGGVDLSQFPSFLADQAKNATPLPAQAMIDHLAGQMDGWETAMRIIGLPITAAHPKKK